MHNLVQRGVLSVVSQAASRGQPEQRASARSHQPTETAENEKLAKMVQIDIAQASDLQVRA
jgi:hypothetical protein